MNAFPKRTAQPSVEPLTAAEARHHLRQDNLGTDDTAYIERLIRAARQACEQRTERTMISTQWRLQLDAFPDAIELLQPPILAITSLQYRDADGDTQTLDPQDYVLDNAREPGYIVPAPGAAWPSTGSGINAVTVNYTAGYGTTAADVPEPLRQWMLLAVAEMYQTRSGSGERAHVRHDFADALLQPYRLLGV